MFAASSRAMMIALKAAIQPPARLPELQKIGETGCICNRLGPLYGIAPKRWHASRAGDRSAAPSETASQ